MARGPATDLAVRNQTIQQHQNVIFQRQIGRTFRLAQCTVCSIIKRFTITGNSRPGKAPDRKPTLTDREVRLFRRHIRKNRHMAVADIVTWARQSFGNVISEASTRRYIKRCGYAFYKARRKSFLTSSDKLRRVAWAKCHLSWTPSQWKKVLWTDESIFEVPFGNIGRKVIRKKDGANDPSYYKRLVYKASSVMVWGCLAANGVGNLNFCAGTIKALDYIRALEVNLRPSVQRLFDRKRYIFQQDDAKSHTAKITQIWLRTKRVSVLE
ncbi:Transposable element Tc1 transposase [Araneus ventricosus]|uniref:Transposable element Tc1 transposase n=1 Tax=Araneus ventricosus TaxID=182803 RepID=A0A4Y2NLH2_ARAVE|nr:Transposable element Tc1 transposase [Araneus ventricosus]